MSILGSVISGTFGLAQQHMQNEFNEEQAKINRQFQSEEAKLAYERTLQADSTKHQREVEDMLAAGINPMLAAGSSGGSVQASPASGSQASAANVGNLGATIAQAMMNDKQMELVDANISKTNAESDKIRSETEGINLQNEITQATKDAKIESERLSNDLTRAKVSEVNSMLDRIAADIKKSAEETKTEAERRSLFAAQRILASAEARQIVQMLPYNKMLAEAKSESDRQAALLSAAHTAYQNHLIDDGYLDAFISTARSTADKTKSEADKAAAEAAVTQMRSAIRTGDYSKTGEFVTDSIARDFFQDITLLLDNINPLNNLFK